MKLAATPDLASRMMRTGSGAPRGINVDWDVSECLGSFYFCIFFWAATHGFHWTHKTTKVCLKSTPNSNGLYIIIYIYIGLSSLSPTVSYFKQPSCGIHHFEIARCGPKEVKPKLSRRRSSVQEQVIAEVPDLIGITRIQPWDFNPQSWDIWAEVFEDV